MSLQPGPQKQMYVSVNFNACIMCLFQLRFFRQLKVSYCKWNEASIVIVTIDFDPLLHIWNALVLIVESL